jgi:hypothetical protein
MSLNLTCGQVGVPPRDMLLPGVCRQLLQLMPNTRFSEAVNHDPRRLEFENLIVRSIVAP